MMKRFSYMHLLVAVMAAIFTACASIGRPEGGPRDETPPVFTGSRPSPGTLNNTRTRFDLYFDENVQLEDAFNKVIVSPVQVTPPSINANGKHVSVELRDTLIPNTTYTIDFADAIKDLNEGNILDGFAIDFSTGDSIDSLRISGMVLEARNLEPAQGMIVGIYSDLADSAISTLPMDRIARTNQYGQFTLRNLKPGTYRIFALNDMNRDYHWDRSENVAFYDVTISPWVEDIVVTDTLRAADGSDSISTRRGQAYLPNDILLSWFNEDYRAQYLKDYSRPDRRRISIGFAAPSDTFPELTIASGPLSGNRDIDWALRNSNATRDTLEYWIRDPQVLATDSLWIAMRYQRTDTLDRLSWTTDTLKFFFKDQKQKKKDKKHDEEADSVPQIDFITFSPVTSSQQEIYRPLIFDASQPIDTIDPHGVRLEMLVDTLWQPVAGVSFTPDSLRPLQRRVMDVEWTYGAKYRLSVDSAAVIGIYNEWNKPVRHEFTVKNPEDYANLVFNISGVDSLAMVELLNSSDQPIATAPVIDRRATLPHLDPGTVYARLYIDSNGNGKWDTGNLTGHIQPEEVYYYPKKLTLRKNWDIEQSWDIYELPVDKQKPYDIKKNKPKLKKGEQSPEAQPEEDEDDPWGTSFGGYNDQYSNSRRR